MRWLQSKSGIARWLRWFAAGSSLSLVFALVALVASPEEHEHLHCDAHEEDHVCAVTLYALGIEPSAEAVYAPRPETRVREAVAVYSAGPKRSLPRYWLRPERGPPSAS